MSGAGCEWVEWAVMAAMAVCAAALVAVELWALNWKRGRKGHERT